MFNGKNPYKKYIYPKGVERLKIPPKHQAEELSDEN